MHVRSAIFKTRLFAVSFFLFSCLLNYQVQAQSNSSTLYYTVGTSAGAAHRLHVQLQTGGWNKDTINFKMPKWTPGYYQLLNYANAVENVEAKDSKNGILSVRKINDNTWSIAGVKNRKFNF